VHFIWVRNKLKVKLLNRFSFQGKVCGLCGNYDGKDGNDFITRTGIIGDAIEFGNSWKVHDVVLVMRKYFHGLWQITIAISEMVTVLQCWSLKSITIA